MFTGIIEADGTVVALRRAGGGPARLVIRGPGWSGDCRPGSSIAISGVCLTVAGGGAGTLEFDVIPETLRRTTLGNLRPGDRVNLERALRAGDRMDGHFVQGHVDGLAWVRRIERHGGEHVVWLEPQAELAPMMIPKGSVAVDGVSLTIAGLERTTASATRSVPVTSVPQGPAPPAGASGPGTSGLRAATGDSAAAVSAGPPAGVLFSVALIPTTLDVSTLGHLHEGDAVNIETDIIARTVLHALHAIGGLVATGAGSSGSNAPHPVASDAGHAVTLDQLKRAGLA